MKKSLVATSLLSMLFLTGCSVGIVESDLSDIKVTNTEEYTTADIKKVETITTENGTTTEKEVVETVQVKGFTPSDVGKFSDIYDSMEGKVLIDDGYVRITLVGVELENPLVGFDKLRINLDVLNKAKESGIVGLAELAINNRLVGGAVVDNRESIYTGKISRLPFEVYGLEEGDIPDIEGTISLAIKLLNTDGHVIRVYDVEFEAE